jgi:NAD(P)-dependent dehydrogenase (short-subunit alcohol dehydrogenase family)
VNCLKEFKDKVAVITGAASGIGLALANKCAEEGMKVVLADIDEKKLRRAERRLKRRELEVISVVTDVSKAGDIEKLAKITLDTYGAIHLLVNNAGIGNTKFTWNYTLKDWEWQLGVCLWGVIHGVRVFLPIMLKQDNECHIVNVSSVEGLIKGSGPGGCIYGLAKHAVVSLTETLIMELEATNAKIKVSVVCPGWVLTNILFGDTHRPEEYQNEQVIEDTRNEVVFANNDLDLEEALKLSPAISPEQSADKIFQGIKDETFYILTHKDDFLKGQVKERFDGILAAFDS